MDDKSIQCYGINKWYLAATNATTSAMCSGTVNRSMRTVLRQETTVVVFLSLLKKVVFKTKYYLLLIEYTFR